MFAKGLTHITIISSIAIGAMGCRAVNQETATTKEVAAYGEDYTTQVPAESVYIRGEFAVPLIKNIKFDQVTQEPNQVTRYTLKLGNDASLSCHSSRVAPPNPETWKDGCHISIYTEGQNAKSQPCDESCQRENPIFASSRQEGDAPFQKVSMVAFDDVDAEKLMGAMTVKLETLNSGIPGFFNDIPGKVISVVSPDRIFSLMCGKKSDNAVPETRCMLFSGGS